MSEAVAIVCDVDMCLVCQILAHQKSNKMEWIIIVLIMGECVLSVVDLYLQLFVSHSQPPAQHDFPLYLSLSLSVSGLGLCGSWCVLLLVWCVCVGP